jgi:hypothetical protein
MNREQEEGMSYQEKKSIANLISSILIFGCYSWYVWEYQLSGNPAAADLPAFWASVILVLIPVSIVAKIIIAIISTILYRITTNETEPSFMDERDKLIELKSTRNSHYVFVAGVLLGMGALVLKMPVHVLFLFIIGAGFLSEVMSVATQLYFYRKGI